MNLFMIAVILAVVAALLFLFGLLTKNPNHLITGTIGIFLFCGVASFVMIQDKKEDAYLLTPETIVTYKKEHEENKELLAQLSFYETYIDLFEQVSTLSKKEQMLDSTTRYDKEFYNDLVARSILYSEIEKQVIRELQTAESEVFEDAYAQLLTVTMNYHIINEQNLSLFDKDEGVLASNDLTNYKVIIVDYLKTGKEELNLLEKDYETLTANLKKALKK